MADTIITATVGTGTQYQVGGTGNVYYFNGVSVVRVLCQCVARKELRVERRNK